jgi:hypothetical protein
MPNEILELEKKLKKQLKPSPIPPDPARRLKEIKKLAAKINKFEKEYNEQDVITI